jgi:hypothetical protein
VVDRNASRTLYPINSGQWQAATQKTATRLVRKPLVRTAEVRTESGGYQDACQALVPVDNQQVQIKAADGATNEENRSESLS